MRRNLRKLAACSALVVVTSGCGDGSTRTSNYALSPMPGIGVEPGWWATIAKREVPPTTSAVPGKESPPQRRTVEVTVPADVLFDQGESTLTSQAEAALTRVAQDIRQQDGHDIAILGFTDHVGTEEFNLQLGQQRADSVATLLVGAGIATDRFSVVQSRGEHGALCVEIRPDGSDDADCRARNRRVVITYTVSQRVQI